ncbi:MAG: ABC transporter permease [Gammaproteobacteria bacterium]
MKYLPLIWAGIWRKRSRAVLMLLQMSSAFLLFGLLQGFNSGLKQVIAKAHADRLYIASSVSLGDPLPISMRSRIEGLNGVRHLTPRAGLPGNYQKPGQGVPVVGADASTYFKVYDEIRVSPQHVAALENSRTGVIAGREVMAKYGWKIGDRVVLQSPQPTKDGSRDWAFDIVGTYDVDDQPANSSMALIANYAYVNESRLTNRDKVDMYVVTITDPADGGKIGLAIDNLFANSTNETTTQSEGDLLAGQLQQAADLDFIVGGIIGAVFFAMLFATGALMMQAIRERVPELAVLKTMGFSDRQVMGLILAESLTFCVFAAAVGLGIAGALLPLAHGLIGIASMPLIVLEAGLGFAVLLALISGAVPAWRGLRLQIASALARG